MALSRSYWEIMAKMGGQGLSVHVGGTGFDAHPDLSRPIIDFLKENNKKFKKQEEEKPKEGPEYE